MTSVPRANLVFESDETLVWFKSSDLASRAIAYQKGFCGRCGGNLFWEPTGEDRVSIAAGTLDGATGLTIERHIYTEDAGDYYDLPEL